ncbi:hypothetical protein BJ322DRAFT_1017915 [Thelephora terrestris]|uniref:Uncharacterized protein n=1 Tax=Thelephora terrestris TaxID=56493 RepID=A0A9P6HK45_9AGAM|nr:hypothetical protein BJ322DRAFT_1017915 [Thelephora terrestris]
MALPFIPVSPEQAAINIARKMEFVREGIMDRGEYLADQTVLERVAWEPYGHGQRLTVIPLPSSTPSPCECDGTPSPANCNRVANDPPDDAALTTNDNSDPSPEPVDVPASPPVPAVLMIVTQLVPGMSWLYPDGCWTGPTRFVDNFTNLKLLCTGGPPTHPRFVNDYATLIANLNSIMDRIKDSSNGRNTIVSGPANYIRVRHRLFVEYEDADSADPAGEFLQRLSLNRSLKLPVDAAYTRVWPTSTTTAAEALASAAETHRVEPLPAYDLNGVLMEPQYYTRRLDGATVVLHFELSHHPICKSREGAPVDTFSARVVQIRVILPPTGASPATPRKKKLLPQDDYFVHSLPPSVAGMMTRMTRRMDSHEKSSGMQSFASSSSSGSS